MIEQPGAHVAFGDGGSVEHAVDVEVVDRHRGVIGDHGARVAGRRLVRLAVEIEILIVIGKKNWAPSLRVTRQQVAKVVTSWLRCWARAAVVAFMRGSPFTAPDESRRNRLEPGRAQA